jgi:hypothetical protein
MTLVEVLVAMGLASVLFLGVTQMAGYSLKAARNVSQITEWSEVRNQIRSTLRSTHGCTRSMRLLHTALPVPGSAAPGAISQLAPLASLPTQNRVAPLRNASNTALPTPPSALGTTACANPAIPHFTMSGGNERIAAVGSVSNGIQIMCIEAFAASVGEVTNWSFPPPPGHPLDIPSTPVGTTNPNARFVTYVVRVGARKVGLPGSGAAAGYLGGGNGEYFEDLRISAWVDASTGQVLQCSEAQTACDSFNGVNLTGGHDPSCVPERWIVGQSNPLDGSAWDFADERMDVALTSGAVAAGGIHSRSGLVMPVVPLSSMGSAWDPSGTNDISNNTRMATRGGITFDDGRTQGGMMASIRVAADQGVVGTAAPGLAVGTTTGFTREGVLWIVGQANSNQQTLGLGAMDQRRVAIRGSRSIEFQGPLYLTDPRGAGTRTARIHFGGNARDPNDPVASDPPSLVFDTSSGGVLAGDLVIQTGLVSSMTEQGTSHHATSATSLPAHTLVATRTGGGRASISVASDSNGSDSTVDPQVLIRTQNVPDTSEFNADFGSGNNSLRLWSVGATDDRTIISLGFDSSSQPQIFVNNTDSSGTLGIFAGGAGAARGYVPFSFSRSGTGTSRRAVFTAGSDNIDGESVPGDVVLQASGNLSLVGGVIRAGGPGFSIAGMGTIPIVQQTSNENSNCSFCITGKGLGLTNACPLGRTPVLQTTLVTTEAHPEPTFSGTKSVYDNTRSHRAELSGTQIIAQVYAAHNWPSAVSVHYVVYCWAP